MNENKALNIALLDDEKESLLMIESSLCTFFETKHQKVNITSFDVPKSFLASIMDHHYDLLLTDIEMPNNDGIEVAVAFKEKEADGAVIFLSNREDRVFDSLKVHPFGFIRKKSFFTDVNQVLSNYLDTINAEHEEEKMILQNGKQLLNLSIGDIIYFESDKKIQHIHLKDGKVIDISHSMKELSDTLYDKGFISTHKAFLVNYRFIRFIDAEEVILTTGDKVYLSRRKEAEVKERYLDLIQMKSPMIIV